MFHIKLILYFIPTSTSFLRIATTPTAKYINRQAQNEPKF